MTRVFFLLSLAFVAACAPSSRGANGPAPSPDAVDGAGAGDTASAPGATAAPLSRADSAGAVLGGDTLQIHYSRPAMRGREIFGGLVPFGQVWRTGANAATSLVTTADLDINGVAVPAGRYTLYSLPEGGADGVTSWQLIVNKQTGQWGTEYHPEQDLARIPLRVSAIAEPVQRFEIRLEPAGAERATLVLQWDRTRGTADVAVKR